MIRIAYDKNGNATELPPDASADWSESYFVKWDGWNWLVEVKDDQGNVVASFEYDGLTRRTTKTADSTTRHYYYSDLSRNPIMERGGKNLYQAFVNNPVNQIDYFGLEIFDQKDKENERLRKGKKCNLRRH